MRQELLDKAKKYAWDLYHNPNSDVKFTVATHRAAQRFQRPGTSYQDIMYYLRSKGAKHRGVQASTQAMKRPKKKPAPKKKKPPEPPKPSQQEFDFGERLERAIKQVIN